uniref:Uncharacterized protein n=1 Tax=Macrostomum lignano TaxID=282301 RepID=A0A1I8FEA0_9PLAT
MAADSRFPSAAPSSRQRAVDDTSRTSDWDGGEDQGGDSGRLKAVPDARSCGDGASAPLPSRSWRLDQDASGSRLCWSATPRPDQFSRRLPPRVRGAAAVCLLDVESLDLAVLGTQPLTSFQSAEPASSLRLAPCCAACGSSAMLGQGRRQVTPSQQLEPPNLLTGLPPAAQRLPDAPRAGAAFVLPSWPRPTVTASRTGLLPPDPAAMAAFRPALPRLPAALRYCRPAWAAQLRPRHAAVVPPARRQRLLHLLCTP